MYFQISYLIIDRTMSAKLGKAIFISIVVILFLVVTGIICIAVYWKLKRRKNKEPPVSYDHKLQKLELGLHLDGNDIDQDRNSNDDSCEDENDDEDQDNDGIDDDEDEDDDNDGIVDSVDQDDDNDGRDDILTFEDTAQPRKGLGKRVEIIRERDLFA